MRLLALVVSLLALLAGCAAWESLESFVLQLRVASPSLLGFVQLRNANQTNVINIFRRSMATLAPEASAIDVHIRYATGSMTEVGFVITSAWPLPMAATRRAVEALTSNSTMQLELQHAIESNLESELPFQTGTEITSVESSAPCRPDPPPPCTDRVTFVFTIDTALPSAAEVRQLMCGALGAAHCLRDVAIALQGQIIEVTLLSVPDAMNRFLGLIGHLRNGDAVLSGLPVQRIQLVDNVLGRRTVVYAVRSSTSPPVRPPDAESVDCSAGDYWWLVFLILLVPIVFAMVRHAYRRGKKRGRLQQQEKDREKHDGLLPPPHIGLSMQQPPPMLQPQVLPREMHRNYISNYAAQHRQYPQHQIYHPQGFRTQ